MQKMIYFKHRLRVHVRTASVSTHNLCFTAKVKKMYYIKVGCEGYKLYGCVIMIFFMAHTKKEL